MTETVACDISTFQPVVDDRYPHDWLTFRGCDGDYQDPNAARNLAWCLESRASGHLRGFGVYVVFRPGMTLASLNILDRLKVPTDCVLMIDAEGFNGEVVGDHSAEINAFAVRLRVRQGGRSDLVWAYGNRGPDLEIWPHKADWLGWVVASYGGNKPDVPNLVGWQYTDGTYSVPGYPNSSPPFGHCDHNVLYNIPEADMPLTDAEITTIANRVVQHPLDANGTTLAQYVRQIRAAQDPAAVAAAVVAKMPPGSPADKATIEAAVRAVFADAGTAP